MSTVSAIPGDAIVSETTPAAIREGASSPTWHVSPWIDVVAYHFSWVWVLIPLTFFGPRHPVDYLPLFIVIMCANFAHRHFTLPYVYLDREVFKRYPVRFVVFPALMLAFFLASPLLWQSKLKTVVSTSAFLAVLWNLYHIHMQKYGIMRLYNAKCMRTGAKNVPPWVDRLLVFGWLPFYLVYLGPANRDLLLEHGPTIKDNTMPLIDGMTKVQPWLLPPAVALVGVSIAIFLVAEWRHHRLRNVPRLSLAAGLTLLSASFLVFNPVKVALAYVFTHAVEYMVFVWAYQRRRYAQELPHHPPLGRILRRPWLAYGGFFLALAAVYVASAYYGRYLLTDHEPLRVAGVTARRWIFYWGIYQSMVHFYFDGFLWKLRYPVVRQAI